MRTVPSTPLLSEDAVIACLARHFPREHDALLLGRGDDCALLKGDAPLAVSTDVFLEDVHFRRSYFTPEEIGFKALAVNVSDMAACGARPTAFTLSLGLPEWVDEPWLEAFFFGMAGLANERRMALAGGDLSRCATLAVSITVFGETDKTGCFLTRGGSMPEDAIFITGSIGLARVGLAVLEAQGRPAIEEWPMACAAHLRPRPQVDAGLMLSRAGANARPPALMDLSDGILRDLPRLLGLTGEIAASGAGCRKLGAKLSLPKDLLHPELIRWAEEQGRDPVLEALFGGEDYALLGSCAPDMAPSLLTAVNGFTQIGTVTDDGLLTCNGVSFADLRGFDHFAAPGSPAPPRRRSLPFYRLTKLD